LTREELFSEILALNPGDDVLVYIERRGENYSWHRSSLGTNLPSIQSDGVVLPDAWIYYSGRWPSKDETVGCWREFFDDLIAEMESMANGVDRCRWPLDDPWPHRH